MSGELALAHIHQPVIAFGVGGKQKEAWIDKIAKRVADDPLHDFAIEKLQAHPYPFDDGRAVMKVEMLVIRVSLKTVYIEHCLNIFG